LGQRAGSQLSPILDIERLRAEFPALALTDGNRPRAYLDNPAGTQVPRAVLERTTECLVRTNANLGGRFATSLAAGEMVAAARQAMADLLGAGSGDAIVFGQNMTSLAFHVSRALSAAWAPGDEVVVTRLDHDANIAPWLIAARERGAAVRWIDLDPRTYELDLAGVPALLGPRTRLVAVGYASNALGTINDLPAIIAAVRALAPRALVFVDAVQYAPHGLIDVAALGCDLLACSPYKFFGPHQGVLWARPGLLEGLPAFKVRPAGEAMPDRAETGTLSHEGMAGTLGAIQYLAWVGETMGPALAPLQGESPRRRALRAAWAALVPYERDLCHRLLDGLAALPGVTVRGIADPAALDRRVPTVSFTHDRLPPGTIAQACAEAGIFVWDGHNYAVEVMRRLGLLARGGALRVGPAHYNTAAEIDRFLDVLAAALRAAR
jgi:cysteine desulfurase family protein (TIGR01976 family)